jgi:hypothetical protein
MFAARDSPFVYFEYFVVKNALLFLPVSCGDLAALACKKNYK